MRVRIRTAGPTETTQLIAIRQQALAKSRAQPGTTQPARRAPAASSEPWSDKVQAQLETLLRAGCVLSAEADGGPVAFAAMEPQSARLIGPYVASPWQRRGIGRRLLVATERLAASMQLFSLTCSCPQSAAGFFAAQGYLGSGQSGSSEQQLSRHFPRRQTVYGRRVARLGEKLGIHRDYARRHRLPLQPEARRLADAGQDIYDRKQRLLPAAAAAWQAMQAHAHSAGVSLQLVSAFRSLDYQAGLIRRKLEQGKHMEQILAVSAAPGYSEHHSGRALDLTTPGAPVLEEAFEDTAAYRWLTGHAAAHGFFQSYPRENPHGVIFEPWHWAFKRR